MTIQAVIPLFPQFTALDGIGPYEVLQRLPEIDVTFIGHERGEVRSDNGFLGITRDATFEEFPTPDLIVFPGGVGTRALMQTSACSSGCATPTARRGSRRRCAPAHSCSAPPGCSTA